MPEPAEWELAHKHNVARLVGGPRRGEELAISHDLVGFPIVMEALLPEERYPAIGQGDLGMPRTRRGRYAPVPNSEVFLGDTLHLVYEWQGWE